MLDPEEEGQMANLKATKLDAPDETRSEREFGPGDAYRIEPGHDAWVMDNEPYVGLDFTGPADYAKA